MQRIYGQLSALLVILMVPLWGCLDLDGLDDLDWELPTVDAGETDVPTGFIGSACNDDLDCAYEGGTCDTSMPSGMCTSRCTEFCPDEDGYPTTFCLEDTGGTCVSRCNYAIFPGSGCRADYSCVISSRNNDPNVRLGACVPTPRDQPPVEDPIPEWDSVCLESLASDGVPFEDANWTPRPPDDNPELLCTLEDPVRAWSPMRGVRFVDGSGDEDPMLVACPMAAALDQMAAVLADLDIVEVRHWGTTNCRTISGTDRLSQHAHGRAIDIHTFVGRDGTRYNVENDWQTNAQTQQARMLRTIADTLFAERIFNTILTPDYNAAHEDHFHVDLGDGGRFYP